MSRSEQMRLLMKAMEKDPNIEKAAAKAGMCRQTASKYLKAGKMPSDLKVPHQWRTRSDPFAEIWDRVEEKLKDAPELEAKPFRVDVFKLGMGYDLPE